ncbi:hypothetical protein EI16_12660 [Hydrogenovibrio marinus]|uniref:Uncharacterized protein n=2 Tax=Hydrogenovibrio marinus TaxID=28885 RepID=A0A066ZR67_HYDMR|nr:hypothetical protein EI16_12660 [Hydrogenovibrio marinus]
MFLLLSAAALFAFLFNFLSFGTKYNLFNEISLIIMIGSALVSYTLFKTSKVEDISYKYVQLESKFQFENPQFLQEHISKHINAESLVTNLGFKNFYKKPFRFLFTGATGSKVSASIAREKPFAYLIGTGGCGKSILAMDMAIQHTQEGEVLYLGHHDKVLPNTPSNKISLINDFLHNPKIKVCNDLDAHSDTRLFPLVMQKIADYKLEAENLLVFLDEISFCFSEEGMLFKDDEINILIDMGIRFVVSSQDFYFLKKHNPFDYVSLMIIGMLSPETEEIFGDQKDLIRSLKLGFQKHKNSSTFLVLDSNISELELISYTIKAEEL